MGNEAKFYIDGRWTEPVEPSDSFAVVDPATEEEVARVAAASPADVDSAVRAAHRELALGDGRHGLGRGHRDGAARAGVHVDAGGGRGEVGADRADLLGVWEEGHHHGSV